jgi:parvulin-like peptidyl-prolyl isomerase
MPLQPARIRALAVRPCFPSLPTWLVVLGVVVAGLLFTRPVAAETPRNDVVAVVNANPITRQDLSQACVERYGEEVLDNMINRHLILQACQQSGVGVTETEVREEIQRIAEKFGLTMQSYLQLLQKERDIAPDQYSREIVWPMLALRRLVADKVQVSDEEFNRAFLSQFGEAVKCRMMMVSKKELADDLHRRATAAPEQFKTLAKQHSEDEASASVGGLIPPIRRHTGDTRIEETVFALQDGGVSPVMQLGDQWILFQAVRRIPASMPSPQALPSIRAQISDRIRDEKMRGAASELFSRLQKQARVEKVLGDSELTQQYPGVAAVINGEKVTVGFVAAECLKRHGLEVLEGEINRMLLNEALRKQGKTVTDEDLQDEIARAAKALGYVRGDGSADVDAWVESVTSDGQTTKSVYIADAVWPSVALGKLVEQDVTVTEQDLRQGFESSYGPRVEVLAIVLSDQRSAQKVWEMARDNPNDEFFGSLAEQYSIEPVSASNRGKVPPIRKHGGQPAIEQEAFQLKPGDLSGIVVTGDKYIILRCQGLTEPVVSEFEAVREELVRDLTEKKTALAMGDYFEQLKASAEIDNFLAAQKKIAQQPSAAPTTR